jgi:NAD(P)H dehydrogenase (quinone)
VIGGPREETVKGGPREETVIGGPRGKTVTSRVVVTGAGGKTGRAVIDAVTADGAPVRALVRDIDRHADLGSRDDGTRDVEVVQGDQREVADLVAALDGCAAVYAIAPNVSPHERVMARALVTACRRAGVPRLVFHSVIHPQLSAMPHHADKAAAEEIVVESGLDWTILQPNAYLQNLEGYAPGLRSGTYRVPYATDRHLAMVDLRDVAEVASRMVLGRLGVHGIFELSGPDELAPVDVARVASELLGRNVVAERQAPEAWADIAGVVPEAARRRLHAMFEHYDRHGSPGDATVLRALLGREPGRLEGYLAELLA